MTEDITCTSMKSLEMNDDADMVALDDYGNNTRSFVYMPQSRFTKRNKNILYITGGSLIIILLVAILLKKSPTYISVIDHKTLQSSQSSNNDTLSPATSINTTPQYFTTTRSTSHAVKPIHLSHALIMTSGRNLWAVDPSSLGNQLLLRQMKRNVVACDVNLNETILWIERNTSVVSRLNDSFGMPFSGKWEPQAIATDYITDKLYVIDKQAGTLNVIDLHRNHTGIVLSDLKDPHDIALDSPSGLMFIVELDYSILRCETDGTSLIEIVKNKPISAIAIDRKMNKIYWVTDFKTIETSNYDGIHHLIIHQADTGNVASLVFHDDKLFWLSTTKTSDKTILYSCKTSGIHCDDLLKHNLPFSTQNIRVSPEPINVIRENPCATNNGECEQLCLLNTKGYICACKIGFHLNRNMKTCDSITKFLLYPDGRYFRGRILDSLGQSFTDAFSPTRFFTLSLEKKYTIDFDRGWNFYEVYFSDDLCIYRLNLTDGNQTKIYHISDFKNYHIKSLLVDRRSDNFYFCKVSNHDESGSIIIITIKEGHVLEKTFYKAQPSSIVLHSEYLLLLDRLLSNIIFFGNGKTWDHFETNGQNKILSINYNENVLYWIENDYTIYYTNIDYYLMKNRNLHNSFNIDKLEINLTTFYVYQKWLFIGDETRIWRFDKKTGSDKTVVVSSDKRNHDFKISGAQISDLNMLKEDKNSVCAIDNGGCEQFCFAREAEKCSCRDDITVFEDTHCK